ncbi:MAG TPA: ArsR family transcriptional regulator [Rhodospirillaceae bacterium]|nr:ArsR family transcriptional regulator [Rhodospirillaceae bacterium]
MDIEGLKAEIQQISLILKSLSNPKRLMALCAMCEGEKSVRELEGIVGISQSALSQHLAKMREDNLVKTRRDAQTIYYSISHPQVVDIIGYLNRLCSRKQVPEI